MIEADVDTEVVARGDLRRWIVWNGQTGLVRLEIEDVPVQYTEVAVLIVVARWIEAGPDDSLEMLPVPLLPTIDKKKVTMEYKAKVAWLGKQTGRHVKWSRMLAEVYK